MGGKNKIKEEQIEIVEKKKRGRVAEIKYPDLLKTLKNYEIFDSKNKLKTAINDIWRKIRIDLKVEEKKQKSIYLRVLKNLNKFAKI